MFIISLISIYGLFVLYSYEKRNFNILIFPILFLLISYTFILQQSSSAHLMGYSYYFSIIFSVGFHIYYELFKKIKYSVITSLITLLLILGIFILCIRVNMLTGING